MHQEGAHDRGLSEARVVAQRPLAGGLAIGVQTGRDFGGDFPALPVKQAKRIPDAHTKGFRDVTWGF